MPEGDTLYRLADVLRPQLLDATVASLWVRRAEFALGAFVGTRVTQVQALGKNLLVHFGNGAALHAHLGMTGKVRAFAKGQEPHLPSAQMAFSLHTDRSVVAGLRVPRVRVLSAARLAADPLLQRLGPDLLAPVFALDEATEALARAGSTPLGVAIMDQRIVAGIGNVYKSELLFRQRLNPFAPVQSHDAATLRALLIDARAVMLANVKPDTGSMGPLDPWARRGRRTRSESTGATPLSVYGRQDKACFECRGRIQMRRQGDQLRSTYFCAHCQQVGP
jgi:endonuclease-8